MQAAKGSRWKSPSKGVEQALQGPAESQSWLDLLATLCPTAVR